MEKIVTGSVFHDFDTNILLVGKFERTVIAEADSEGRKAGDLMGFEHTTEDGKSVIVGSAHAIKTAIEKAKVKEGDIMGYYFLGKTQNRNNQPFNRFEVCRFSSFEEANTYYKQKQEITPLA